MGEGKAIGVENFSHVCVGVSDMDAALAFYTGVLGMDVAFDVNLEGEGLESVTGSSGAHGRMVGGLVGGTMVELLDLGNVPASPEGPHLGYTNISFRVRNLDETNCFKRRQPPDRYGLATYAAQHGDDLVVRSVDMVIDENRLLGLAENFYQRPSRHAVRPEQG